MKLLNIILTPFRLFFISIFKRLKSMNQKSYFVSLLFFLFFINIIFNILTRSIKSKLELLNNTDYLSIIFLFLSISLVILDIFINKNDKLFLFKYKKIITKEEFEFLLFLVLGITLIPAIFLYK